MMLPKLFTLFCLIALANNVQEATGKKLTAKYWTGKFNMGVNPAGGWYAEIYRSPEKIGHLPERYGINATRVFSTQAYYLLEGKDFYPFHQLKSTHLWHFYHGARITLFVIDHVTGELTRHHIGKSAKNFVVEVKHGDYYAARLTYPGQGKYSLLGLTTTPGFEIEDYYQPTTEELITKYPQHKKFIKSLTRE
ncbi:uncharacterized protein LOC120326908 [Styela clava]